jgi:hypothetical protein
VLSANALHVITPLINTHACTYTCDVRTSYRLHARIGAHEIYALPNPSQWVTVRRTLLETNQIDLPCPIYGGGGSCRIFTPSMSLLSSEHVYNRTKNHYKFFDDPYLRNGLSGRRQILTDCQPGLRLRFDTKLTSIRPVAFELGKGPPHFRPPLTPQWMEIPSRCFRISRRTAGPNALAKFCDPGSIERASFWGSKFRAFAALRDLPVPGERANMQAASIVCSTRSEAIRSCSLADD